MESFSKRMKSIVAVMAMMVISIPFYGQTWDLVALSDLTSGDVFMIVDTASGTAMTNDNGTSSAPSCFALTFNANMGQVTTTTIPDNVKWNISGDATDGYTFYPDGTTEMWLYCNTTSSSGNNNNMRVGTGTRNLFLLHENNLLKTNDDITTRYIGVYNAADWRGYTSVGSNIASTRIAFYKYNANVNAVATPIFLPVAGTYNGTQNITISCPTEDATIRYTLDGTDPTDASTEYTAAIEISANTTIKAKAWKDGLTASEIATAEYVITNYTPLDAPTFSPVAGTYTGVQQITILAAEGATIRYTLDGTDPTETSTEYTGAITISSDMTVKARAWKEGFLPSEVASANYVIEIPTVTFNKLASHTQITTSDVYMIVDVTSGRALTSANGTSSAPTAVAVTIENDAITAAVPYELQWKFAEEEGGYSIYPATNDEIWLYTTDGNNSVRVGTNENKVWEIDVTDATETTYHGMKNVAFNRYLGVYNTQNWRTYTSVNNNIKNTQIEFFILGDAPEPAPSAPAFSPVAGTYTNSVDVSLTCETNGATIYYTLDGTDPTDASTAYADAIHITETTTVKAIAIKNALSSEIVSATYTITNMEVVATPVITPEAGNYNEPQQITITCATDDALIYYTTDGNDPTAESTLYEGPFTLSESATVKAVAVKEGYTNSDIATAAYTMPVFLENLAAVYSTANNDQYRITGDVTFVFRSGRYMFVKDATAGMLIYDNATSVITNNYENGDVISGGISGKTSIYNGLYEVVPTANLAASTENAGAVEPTIVTIEQLSNGNDYMSQLVTVQNLTVTGTSGQNIIVTDGINTIKIFDRFNLITESDYTANDIVTVTGFVSKYNSDYQVFPRTAADIVKREAPAEPTFTPEAGTYTASVTVTLACETDGATIYYTLNDTDTETEYTAPLTFTETTTVHAFAEKEGMRSAVVTAIYTITDMETVATPVITPDGGTFVDTQEVTITCETADASIYYTLNGEEPTAESNLYSTPIVLEASATVKAIAMKENMMPSEIVSATFTKDEPAVAANYVRITSLSQLQDGDKVVIASRYDNDATHYKVAPTRIANSRFNAVDVTVENDIITTDVDSIVWTLSIEDDNYRFVNASDASLGWSSSTNFSSGSNYDWSVEECTANGLVPNYTGYKITNLGTINLSTVRAIAFRGGSNNVFGAYSVGNVDGNEYNFALDIFVKLEGSATIVATPTFSVPAGNYTETQSVEILCATDGATIRYTLDESDPTEESEEYVAAIEISQPTTIKAKAFKQDCIASAVAEAFYNVVTTPAIIVSAEELTFSATNESQTLNVSSLNLTTDITVTVTDNFTVDAETITMNTDATLTVTFTGDEVTTGTLTLTSGETVATVALVANPPVVVNYYRIASLSQLNNGDKLIIASRYDEDNTHFYVASARIASKLSGIALDVENDVIATDVDTIVWTVSIDGDNYTFTNASGANLGYGSGTNFSNSSNTTWNVAEFTSMALVDNYSGFKITNVTTNTRAVAFRAGTANAFGAYATSNDGNDEYNFALDFFVDLGDNVPTVATPVFTPAAGYYEEAQNVTIACATEGATIYYTTDGTEPTSASTQYTEPIAVSQNTTIKAIAYVGEEFSVVATAHYTFPTMIDNIAALYALTSTQGNFRLTGDVTFVFRSDRNIYVKDATGGLLIYDSGNKITTEYNEGDVISGGIAGTISMYHGLLEYVPVANTAASTQNVGPIAPIDITVEQLCSNNYVSQLVRVLNVSVETGNTYTEGSTGNNTTFSQNGNEAVLRNNFKTLDMTIGDNTNWNITGFAVIYDTVFQIYPRSNDDVSIVTSVDELAAEISVYPNPTSDIVNIVTDGNAQRVEVANVDGQIVSSEAVSSDVISISLEAQPAGMYFVRIYTANEVIVRKVTKF